MLKLVLSPSQQNGIEEDLIKPIAQRLYDLLKADNLIDVVLCPYFTGADETALYNAIQWSNQQNADYHFTLHADAGYNATGASGLYYSEKGKAFITPITQAIMDITPWGDIGIKYRDNLGELKRTNAVAGLLEISFYDNPEELAWMKANTDLIARTIQQGIYKALCIVPKNDDGKYKIAYSALYKGLEELYNKFKLLEG